MKEKNLGIKHYLYWNNIDLVSVKKNQNKTTHTHTEFSSAVLSTFSSTKQNSNSYRGGTDSPGLGPLGGKPGRSLGRCSRTRGGWDWTSGLASTLG